MTGVGSGLIDPQLVEKLIEAQKISLNTTMKRKENIQKVRKEIQKFSDLLNDLDKAINSIKTKGDFYKLKAESSHPDIIDAVVEGKALPGSYEFEVRDLARTDKDLAFGFPDKDKTPVGFGYMLIEREDTGPLEIIVKPHSTLQDVANQINDANAGVRAMIINTKSKTDPYRLLVISEKSGEEAKIKIDEDTTFLEFKEQVRGRNLDVLFEDVPITDDDNILEDLVEGVVFNVKRAEPGTKVQLNITYDVDATLEAIKNFVNKYNEVVNFVHQQYKYDPQTKKAGLLAAEGSLRNVMRSLQSVFSGFIKTNGKYNNLASLGITTDPKTGTLNIDEAKIKKSLSENYDEVAALFIRTNNSVGIADKLSAKLAAIRDPQAGPVKARLRSIDNMIKNIDKEIERKEREFEQKEQQIRRRFSALDSQLSNLANQGMALQQRFGGGGVESGAGGSMGMLGGA